jgi:hypothetical protein
MSQPHTTNPQPPRPATNDASARASFPFNTNLPLDERFDVVVVGGGPAGVAAATAAAREGAKTLLVEASGCLGGMGTAALVPSWAPFWDYQKIIYRGLAGRVFNQCKAAMPGIPADRFDWVPIDSEHLKRVYDSLAQKHGVEVLFHTRLAAVWRGPRGDMDGGVIVLASKAGLSAVKARVYIDCTGDADLAAWAGAPVEIGGTGKKPMPATLCFILCNVDTDKIARSSGSAFDHTGVPLGSIEATNLPLGVDNPDSPIHAIVASGLYPLIKDTHVIGDIIAPGVVSFNAGHLYGVDGTDPASLSRAMAAGRAMAAQFRDGLARFHPAAFGRAFLVETAALMGVRDSRRVTGDYIITLNDYLARRTFPDEIARNAYYIDQHPDTPADACGKQARETWEKSTFCYKPGESHGIPYRSLTARGLRNVLVAGRCISADLAVQASVRVMPVCLVTGEAAGVAAAIAANKHGGDVRAVDAASLRARLREHGAWLPET